MVAYRAANLEKIRARAAAYREKHRERLRERGRVRGRVENMTPEQRERACARAAARRAANLEVFRERARRYRSLHRGERRKSDAAYKRANRAKVNAWQRAQRKTEARREKNRAYQRQWRKANPEKAASYSVRFRAKHPERELATRERHRPKKNAKQREYFAKNPDVRREKVLRNVYRLEPVAAENLLSRQGHACALCSEPFTTTPRVDHDHKTGKVRGFLCHGCNVGLGALGDSREGFLRMAALPPDEVKKLPFFARRARRRFLEEKRFHVVLSYLARAEGVES